MQRKDKLELQGSHTGTHIDADTGRRTEAYRQMVTPWPGKVSDRSDLGIGCDDVEDAEDGYCGQTEDPHDDLLPEGQGLQEPHFRSIVDIRQMLLTIRMSHKLRKRRKTSLHIASVIQDDITS